VLTTVREKVEVLEKRKRMKYEYFGREMETRNRIKGRK
jgi:hypothetical protein